MTEAHKNIETSYISSTSDAHRKAFSQFFTPPKVAELMAEWISSCNPKLVADIGTGTGILTQAVKHICAPASIIAVEMDLEVSKHFRQRFNDDIELVNTNYLEYRFTRQPDAIISNPPYLRWQSVMDSDVKSVETLTGVTIKRTSNLYVLFVMKMLMDLKEGGRASILIPTEWMNTGYGAGMKRFLVNHCRTLDILYFPDGETIFDNALTTACVLMIEKK